jgi:hypothetical protein
MNVETYIESAHNQRIVAMLYAAKQLLEDSIPNVQLLIKWRVPFFMYHGHLCYLGKHKDHITIGFFYGHQLSNVQQKLHGEADKLKQVRYLRFYEKEQLYEDVVIEILAEAMMVNEENLKKKKRKRTK